MRVDDRMLSPAPRAKASRHVAPAETAPAKRAHTAANPGTYDKQSRDPSAGPAVGVAPRHGSAARIHAPHHRRLRKHTTSATRMTAPGPATSLARFPGRGPAGAVERRHRAARVGGPYRHAAAHPDGSSGREYYGRWVSHRARPAALRPALRGRNAAQRTATCPPARCAWRLLGAFDVRARARVDTDFLARLDERRDLDLEAGFKCGFF